MYSSHYDQTQSKKEKSMNIDGQNHSQNISQGINQKAVTILQKSIPQYLFLNLVKNLSILYLVLTISNIPVYIGATQLSQVYYQQIQQQPRMTDYILYTTLFALHQNISNTTFMNFTIFPDHQLSNSTLNSSSISFNSFNLSWTSRQFNAFVVWYFLILSLMFAFGLSMIQISNHKLYLKFKFGQNLYQQMTQQKYSNKYSQIIQEGKIVQAQINRQNFKTIHIQNIGDIQSLPIYIVIPKIIEQIKQRVEKKFNAIGYKFQRPRVRLEIRQQHKTYLQTIHRIHQLQIKIEQANNEQLQKVSQISRIKQSFIEKENGKQMGQMLIEELKQIKLKMIRAKIHLEEQMNKNKLLRSCYYYPHLFLQFKNIQHASILKNLKLTDINYKINKQNCNSSLLDQQVYDQDPCQNHMIDQYQHFNCFQSEFNRMFQTLKIDQFEKQNIIFDNCQVFSHAWTTTQTQNSSQFINHFIAKYEPKKYMTLLLTYLISLLLIIAIDIVILIIQKSNIFSYSTSLITLILQTLLKGKIIFISKLQSHKLWSHLHLSIFIKLTLLLYFNLCLLLIIGNYDWNAQWIKNALSKNFVKNFGDLQWYRRVGVILIILLIVQTLYCSIRVYLQIGKSLLFGFIQSRISTFSLSRFRTRIKQYIEQYKQKYVKPVIDIQICYSHIISVYLTGISFSYPFPILYPLMLIFSLLIYNTHVRYVQLYTQKLMYNGDILLNNFALIILFLGVIVGIIVMQFIQFDGESFDLKFWIWVALVLVIMIGTKLYIFANYRQCQNHLIMRNFGHNNDKNGLPINFNDMINQASIKMLNFRSKNKQMLQKQLIQVQIELIGLTIFNKQHCMNNLHNKYFESYKTALLSQKYHILKLISDLKSQNQTNIKLKQSKSKSKSC